jgi:thioredoxin-like negative regulator of GroEL
MIMFFADWCGYCQRAKDLWMKFRKVGGKKYIIAAVDTEKHKGLTRRFNVRSFPSIFIVDTDGKLIPYQGQRDFFDLVLEMCKSVKDHALC